MPARLPFYGVPTGYSEYQDGISKLGEVILRYDIHARQYLDSINAKPCQHCVSIRPGNWLANKLNRYDYKAMAESQIKDLENLERFNEEMLKMGQPVEHLPEVRYCPYFISEYQFAYGPFKRRMWIKGKPQLF